MAPNFSGTLFETHQAMVELNKCCLEISLQMATAKSNLVMKTIQGEEEKALFWLLEYFYESVIRFKP